MDICATEFEGLVLYVFTCHKGSHYALKVKQNLSVLNRSPPDPRKMRNKCSQQRPVSSEREAHVKHSTTTMQRPSEVFMTPSPLISELTPTVNAAMARLCQALRPLAAPVDPPPVGLRASCSLIVGSAVLQLATNHSADPCGLSEVLFCCCCGCLQEDEAGEFSIRETYFPVIHLCSVS